MSSIRILDIRAYMSWNITANDQAENQSVGKDISMIKAVFLDYTGTMVKEDEPYTRELLKYFLTHSSFKSPSEILGVVWGKIKEFEADSFGDNFIKNHEKVSGILEYCKENYGLKGDFDYIHETWQKVWIYAPLYKDVKPFFERCKLPIYVLSNDDLCYLEESMKIKGLKPAGIISAETARACKPNKLIFEKALELAGVKPEEVTFVGDSVKSDIEPALSLGINPVLIVRGEDKKTGGCPEGVKVIGTLDEIL